MGMVYLSQFQFILVVYVFVFLFGIIIFLDMKVWSWSVDKVVTCWVLENRIEWNTHDSQHYDFYLCMKNVGNQENKCFSNKFNIK